MNRLAALFFFASALSAGAQMPTPTPSPSPVAGRDFWQADMPGGTYIVKLSLITSVSTHEYLVDGAARVTEVTVGTLGSELARFYYLEANIPQTPHNAGQSAVNLAQEKIQNLTERFKGEDVWKAVVKNYPTTTHARTIEYRLASKDALKSLFLSLQAAWLSGKGTTFKP